MQLKSLRVFCDVAAAGSFSRGAEANGMSQSAASQLVQQLEEELGVKLIDRSKRPWILTPEGDCFYSGCRKIVRQYNDLESQVKSFHADVAGSVRVASIYSVGLSHMNEYVKTFLRRHPKASVQLQYEHPARVYSLVERDAVDLGLVSYPKSSRHITADPWREEAIVLACAPQNKLASKKIVSPSDLEGLDMICFEDGLKIRQRLDRELGTRGVTVNAVMEFDNTEIIKRAIETDSGVGLMPEPTVAREVQMGMLVAIPVLDESGQPAMKRPLGIVHRRGRQLSTTAQRFIRELQEREPARDEHEKANAIAANRPTNGGLDSDASEASQPQSAAPTNPR